MGKKLEFMYVSMYELKMANKTQGRWSIAGVLRDCLQMADDQLFINSFFIII